MDPEKNKVSDIVYSCYYSKSREGEHFVPEQTLSFQVSGNLILNDGAQEYPFGEGSIHFVRRNQLMKFVKYPPEKGEYRSITLYLTQEMLKKFSAEFGFTAQHSPSAKTVWNIRSTTLLQNYFSAMPDYLKNERWQTAPLTELKIKEGVLLLLQAEPELKTLLFDFTDPHKIDLEAFMNKNFHFNVQVERFAYLTGRSLAGFKRDFEKQFNTSPGRWLLKKRLEEAYFLITKKGRAASDIYVELGFEDLSHFSYAFKKQFGKAPSRIAG